jgi:hypothetical protein
VVCALGLLLRRDRNNRSLYNHALVAIGVDSEHHSCQSRSVRTVVRQNLPRTTKALRCHRPTTFRLAF